MRPTLRVFFVAVSLVFGGSLVFAHGGATGVVKERMELMENIGKAMKTLTAIFKGERDYDAETVKAAAASISDHAGARMTKLFPEDSLDKPSEALPAVWQHWSEFETLADRLAAYSNALVEAAGNPRGQGAGASMMSQGQGMMGQGQGMMGQGQGMMGQGQGMRGAGGPDAEALAAMPPDAAFMHTAQTCNACHTKFRAKKN